jgi:hypothetical protein
MSSRSNYYAQYPNQRPHGILPSSLYPTISPSPAPTLSLLPLPLPSPSPSFPYHASSWPIPVPVHVPSSSPRERPQRRSKRNLSITVPPPPRLATLQAYQPLDSSLGLSPYTSARHSSSRGRFPPRGRYRIWRSPRRRRRRISEWPTMVSPGEWEWEWGRAGEGDR